MIQPLSNHKKEKKYCILDHHYKGMLLDLGNSQL